MPEEIQLNICLFYDTRLKKPYIVLRKHIYDKEQIKEIIQKGISEEKFKISLKFNNSFVAAERLIASNLLSEKEVYDILNLEQKKIIKK